MPSMTGRSLLPVIALSGVLLAAAPAAASTASRSGATVTIEAATGESNRVILRNDETIVDEAGVTPGPGCTALSATQVECGTGWLDLHAVLGDGHDRLDLTMLYAEAVHVDAGPGDDTIALYSGTTATIDGGTGNDDLAVRWSLVTATIDGGEGDDRLQGDDSADVLRGGPGADVLTGGGGGDTLDGGAGTDSIDGDGTGNLATSGNDRILVRDGERDTVGCGLGADVVTADAADVTTSDCEAVDRAGSATQPGTPAAPATGKAVPKACRSLKGAKRRTCVRRHRALAKCRAMPRRTPAAKRKYAACVRKARQIGKR